jgi:hypothetical protein
MSQRLFSLAFTIQRLSGRQGRTWLVVDVKSLHSMTSGQKRVKLPDFVNRREHNIGREVARDAICETGHHQRRSAFDRGNATIPELAIIPSHSFLLDCRGCSGCLLLSKEAGGGSRYRLSSSAGSYLRSILASIRSDDE